MRWIGPGTIVLAALIPPPLAVPAAHADPYKWCAHYGGREDGGTNCGFVTYQQCVDTVRGIGGWCEPNPFYDGRPYDSSENPSPRRLQRPRDAR